MKKNKRLTVIVLIIIGILIPVIVYFFHFKNSHISTKTNDWGSFGGYLDGTIGGILSSLSFILLYFTFVEQKEDQLEIKLNSLIDGYHKIIENIHENWMHKDEREYLKGREIFGRAIGNIDVRKDYEGVKKSFQTLYNLHINVFEHYENYIFYCIDYLSQIGKNEYSKEELIRRFMMQFSFFEKKWILFSIEFLHEDKKNGLYQKLISNYFLNENDDGIPNQIQLKWISKKVKDWC